MIQLSLYIIFCISSYSHSFEYLGQLVGNADVKAKIDYDGSFSSAAHADFLGTKLDQYRSQLSLNVPVYQKNGEVFGVATDVQSLRLRGYDFASDPRVDLKNNFEGYAFGGFYRSKLPRKRAIAVYATMDSKSDKPFSRTEDNGMNILAVYKIQQTPASDLVFVVAYSNHRTILSGIPIPGIAHVWNPKPELFAVFGLPANYILIMPFKNFIVTATAVLPVTFKADFNYRFWGPLLAFAGWEMDHRYFFVSDRLDRDDKVFFDEKQVSAGVKMLFSKTSYITFAANYDYYNSIFESEGYYDSRNWAIDLAPHWNFDMKATFSF